jgi:hypothetical protein
VAERAPAGQQEIGLGNHDRGAGVRGGEGGDGGRSARLHDGNGRGIGVRQVVEEAATGRRREHEAEERTPDQAPPA